MAKKKSLSVADEIHEMVKDVKTEKERDAKPPYVPKKKYIQPFLKRPSK